MTITEILLFILKCVLMCVFIKSITIGSDFNFYLAWKYRGKYCRWYFDPNRTTFEPESVRTIT